MKYLINLILLMVVLCRSREGAWIEMSYSRYVLGRDTVAPARERGLKSVVVPRAGGYALTVAPARERGLKWLSSAAARPIASRSREGAWIEIRFHVCT